jgi:hypothetical protein
MNRLQIELRNILLINIKTNMYYIPKHIRADIRSVRCI